MRVTKDSKAITLIALVITIIVLLILAGVALATLTGNGSIIDNANYAVEEYNKSANSDQNVLNQVENLFAKYMGESSNTGDDDDTPAQAYTITYNANGGTGTMESQTASTTATNAFTPPTGKLFKEWNTAADRSGTSYAEGATVSSNLDLYAIWYVPLSSVVHVGDYITYDATLGVAEEDEGLLNYTSYCGELKVKKTQDGDEYLINEEGMYTCEYDGAYNLLKSNGEFEIPANSDYYIESDVPGNGYEDQEFTAIDSTTLWRIWDVNTETGVVKIVPDIPMEVNYTHFFFQGLRGYKNAVRELNNASAIFGHGQGANGAVSATIEEVNALTGYTAPQTLAVTVGNVGTWNDSWYFYKRDDYEGANEKIASMLWKDIFGGCSGYWLASTFVGPESNGLSVGIRNVEMNCWQGVYYDSVRGNATWTLYHDGDTSEGCYYVQDYGDGRRILPVVTLLPTVEYLGGTGEDDEDPWIFQVVEDEEEDDDDY